MKTLITGITSGFVSVIVTVFIFAQNSSAEMPRNHLISLDNFHVVSSGLYRSARPSLQALNSLRAHGLKTIIDLETDPHSIDDERNWSAQNGVRFYSRPMISSVPPNDDEVQNILALLQDQSQYPLLVHCYAGEDRTGLIVGLFRVLIERWKPQAAYQEMVDYGFHPGWQALLQYFEAKTNWRP